MGAFMNVFAAMWPVVQPYVGSAVRHGLTIASGYLVAKGLPGLADGTAANLAAVAAGAAGMGWSFAEKYVRA